MVTPSIKSSLPAPDKFPTSGSDNFKLKTEDFIKMMITQLQNQDPLEPAKNQELLAQMSEIGQLQSSNQLTTSLQGMVLQNNLGAAGNLIGKMVKGSDEQGKEAQGLVSSVRVQDSKVYLELDNGKSMQLEKVNSIEALDPAGGKAAGAGSPGVASTGVDSAGITSGAGSAKKKVA